MSERSSRHNRLYGLSGSQSPFPARHREFLTQGLPKSGYTRTHRAALLDGTQFWRTLDQSQILGDGETYGHLGCVNALSWSHDGSQLVSGSDDAR
jgi:WD40 repeat protein